MCTATSDSAMPQLLTVTAALPRLDPERAMCALAGMLRQPQAGGSGSGKMALYYQPVAGPGGQPARREAPGPSLGASCLRAVAAGPPEAASPHPGCP